MRRLCLAGWEVTAAALNPGDADAMLAEALGIEFVALPPFAPMDADALGEAAALAAAADVIVVCDVPFGHGNLGNLEAAVRAGRPLVLVGDIAGRDYTGGDAEALWADALAAGAIRVEAASEVDAALGPSRPPGSRRQRRRSRSCSKRAPCGGCESQPHVCAATTTVVASPSRAARSLKFGPASRRCCSCASGGARTRAQPVVGERSTASAASAFDRWPAAERMRRLRKAG